MRIFDPAAIVWVALIVIAILFILIGVVIVQKDKPGD